MEKLYTVKETQELVEEFRKHKLDQKNEREVMDYVSVIQTMAKAMDEFLQKHGKRKMTRWLGMIQMGDE